MHQEIDAETGHRLRPRVQRFFAENTGYRPETLPMVRRFAAAFGGYDAVVTPSGSCAGMVRDYHRVVAASYGDDNLVKAVEQVIRRVAARCEFDFVARNIASDPADYGTYKDDIPVVMVNGVEIARHRMTAAQLEKALGISR